jgi:hypothetical protein
MDGGRLGWGLVRLLWQTMGEIPGTIVLFLLWMLAAATGFGLWAKLEAWLLKSRRRRSTGDRLHA